MTKDIKQIQEENRKLILGAVLSGNNLRILKEEIGDFSGLPLTLSKVLLALEKRFCYFHLTGGKDFSLIEISVDTGKIEENGDPIYFEFNWDIKKETLEEQTPEVQIAINKLLKGENNDK